ncbi:MAG: hypothetical protein IJQ07_05465 [Clostridia bacterium]|nr:hypothetical protein [Clostridia bacterium]
MKRLYIFLSVLLLCSFFLGACNIFPAKETEQGISPSEEITQQEKTHRINYNGLFTADWDFKIIETDEDSGYFYPTVSGTIQCDTLPDKITVTCNGKEKIIEIDTLTEKNDCYILTFNQYLFYGYIEEGEYEAVLKGYFPDGIKEIDDRVNLIADRDLFFNGNEMEDDTVWTLYY